MLIPSIHVGCGDFSLQRLEVLANENFFNPVACVDIDVENARNKLSKNNSPKVKILKDKIYSTISDAKKNHNAKACFIFVSSKEHSKLIVESLNLGLHTYCVKSIACNQKEFKDIIKAHKQNPKLIMLQGFNNQWNEAAQKMRDILQNEKEFGKMLGGECVCWGRQNLKRNPPVEDVSIEGMFFYSLACHQLSQLVAAKGLPEYVTAYVHKRIDEELDYKDVFGTTGGQCIFEYENGVPFSYTGTRAAHGNIFGFASRWSGQWIIHGEKADLRRVGGRVSLYKNGSMVNDLYLKDLDQNLIEDEKIQFKNFFLAITEKKNKDWLQESSLNTWILMEACNLSSRLKKKISIKELKSQLLSS